MTDTTLFGGLSLAAIGVAAWGWVRMLLSRVVSLAVVRVQLYDQTANAVQLYCWRHCRRSPFGMVVFGSCNEYVRPRQKYQTVGFETAGADPVLFWRGWVPLFVGALRGGVNDAKPYSGASSYGIQGSLQLTFLRGTLQTDRLVQLALDELNQQRDSGNGQRYRIVRLMGSGRALATAGSPSEAPNALHTVNSTDVYLDKRLLGWRREELGPRLAEGAALDTLYLPVSAQQAVEELRRWKASEDWYHSRGIPWRRGWSLIGPPGTGKTSLVRALAQDLDLPVFVYDLASMSNKELVRHWEDMLGCTPCVALLEDLDTVFHGRENILKQDGGGLSFDCLLNCLSGIKSADGVITMITTNNAQHLDPALALAGEGEMASRPGRVDRVVRLGPLDREGRGRMARRIMADWPDIIEALVDTGNGDTGAQFQERCTQAALALRWNGVTVQEMTRRMPKLVQAPVECMADAA
jgi:hypothetical protein